MLLSAPSFRVLCYICNAALCDGAPLSSLPCAARVATHPLSVTTDSQVLVFDDSFEHEVANDTALPRLVLIVDLWHPGLNTYAKRLAALEGNAAQTSRYRGVVEHSTYTATTERGH